MNERFSRPLAAVLLLAAGAAFAGEAGADTDARRPDAEERLGQLCEMVEFYADSGFRNMECQYGSFKGYVDRGEGDILADALLRVARENASATNETQLWRSEFALTWLDEFGETNALPFLLEAMKWDLSRGVPPWDDLSIPSPIRGLHKSCRHMTIASFFRIANRKNATNALHEAAAMLADEKWDWMRQRLYFESTQTVQLHESSDRLEVAKAGGGVVNLRPVREPICVFLADCYENETDPGRFAYLDGFIRSKLPEWKTSDRRLRGAQRMLRLHPESKEASGIVRSVQDARAAQPPDGSAPVQPGDVSDTETVDPYVPPPPGEKFQI